MNSVYFDEILGGLIVSGVCVKQLLDEHRWSPNEIMEVVQGNLHDESIEIASSCRSAIKAKCDAFALAIGNAPADDRNFLAYGYTEWALAGIALAKKKNNQRIAERN